MDALKPYAGSVITILATAALTYCTLGIDLGWFKSGAEFEAWKHIGLIFVSLLASSLVNIGAVLSVRAAERRASQAEDKFRGLIETGRPALLVAMEHELQKRFSEISTALSRADLSCYVFATINGEWRVVSSTRDLSSPVRRVALSQDEGVIGVAAAHGAPVVVSVQPDGSGNVFNLHSDQLTETSRLSPKNRAKTDVGLVWIYATPVFAASPDEPIKDVVVGMVSVDSGALGDSVLMNGTLFQENIAHLAMDLSPFLSAFHAITHTHI